MIYNIFNLIDILISRILGVNIILHRISFIYAISLGDISMNLLS